MKNGLLFGVLLACLSAQAQSTNDAERLRISQQRAALETGFEREDTACYKKFLVTNCLNEVNIRRRDALADLRRQEISINDEERKARGAEQVQKTEDKASLENQQQEADQRAEAVKRSESRIANDQQKNADRVKAESSEKANAEAAAAKLKSSQGKEVGRTAKQGAAAEEVKKYNERLDKAKDRRERLARDKASQTKPPANPLPSPQQTN